MGTHTSVPQVGNIRLEAQFKTSLAKSLTFVIYSVMEGGVIEIDKNRSVYSTL